MTQLTDREKEGIRVARSMRNMATKLIAIPFGKDGVSGDSTFYVGQDEVPATEESTFEELAALHEDSVFDHEGEICDSDIPDGFWLLTEENRATVELVANVQTDTDSETCRINHLAKKLCAKLATKTLKATP